MATLNELKKRLRSIKTTGQLAGAMKTVSTAKYSKLCSVLEQYRPYAREAFGMLSAAGLSGRDDMEIAVFGNEERILLTARYDNLGKGASGAAVEALNIVLGIDKTTGLNIG